MSEAFPFRGLVSATSAVFGAQEQNTVEKFPANVRHMNPPEVMHFDVVSPERESLWTNASTVVDAGRPATGANALYRFGATYELTEKLITDREHKGVAGVYFNPAGGNHSEQHEGISDYNDGAYAAMRLSNLGYNVMVLDTDMHHNVEIESLLRDEKPLTISVHVASTAATTFSDPEKGFINYPLNPEAGTLELFDYLDQAEAAASRYFDYQGVDVILLIAGSEYLDSSNSPDIGWVPEIYAVLGDRIGRLSASTGASVLVLGGGSKGLDKHPTAWCNLLTGLEAAQHLGALVQYQTGLTNLD